MDIHYTDAILTVLFGAGVAFMLWSVREFMRLNVALVKHQKAADKRMAKFEKQIRKQIVVANAEGAKIVANYFDALHKGKHK